MSRSRGWLQRAVKLAFGGYDFRDSHQIRRRWLLYRTLALICFGLGGVLVVVEVVLIVAGERLSSAALALTVMVFGVPGLVLWVKSKDHALFWREEVERERLSDADKFPDEGSLGFRDIRPEEADLVRALMSEDFPGRVELQLQLSNVVVKQIDENGSLSLRTSAAVTAPVDRRIPVEAAYDDVDGIRVHLLLHVVDGFVDELEVYRDDSAPVISSPLGRGSIDFDRY